MSDLSIRQDFIDGINEVFTTLFNYGDNSGDGILFYPLWEEDTNIYGEIPYKEYKKPINFIAQVKMFPQDGLTYASERYYDATFVIPLQSFITNNVDVSLDGLETLKKGVIEWDGRYFQIEKINPKAFVEDVFHLYDFNCMEDKDMKTIVVYEDLEEEEEIIEDGE